jgi:hypothetical protein
MGNGPIWKYGPTLMVLKNRLTTVLKKSKPYCVGKKTDSYSAFYCLVVALIKMFLNNYKDKTS